MPVISFSVFKDKIKSGEKCQTIRAKRKYPIKAGDPLYLWWKQRTPEREFLGEEVIRNIKDDDLESWERELDIPKIKIGTLICKSVSSIEIHEDCFLIDHDTPTKGNGKVVCDDSDKEDLAIADGFDNWEQLVEFFEKTHGLPFEGVLIKW